MARPPSVPTWATNANYTTGPVGVIGTATKTAPTAPVSTDGWKPADEPGAQNFNYVLNLIGAWLTWINSNLWEGLITFVDAITFNSLITAKAGLTADVNQNITVSGTGGYKHGTRTLSIPASEFNFRQANTADGGGGTVFSNSGFPFSGAANIKLPNAKRITAVRFFVKDSATGPTKVQGTLSKTSGYGVISSIGTTSVSAGSGADQTLTVGSLPTTLTIASYLLILQGTTGTAICLFYGCEVDYDE